VRHCDIRLIGQALYSAHYTVCNRLKTKIEGESMNTQRICHSVGVQLWMKNDDVTGWTLNTACTIYCSAGQVVTNDSTDFI